MSKFLNVIVVMDEVYEHMVYDDYTTLPRMSNIPGMWDKTISIMSSGKIFSTTGIRLGWAIAPKKLIDHINAIHQYNSFCLYDPIQSTS
jgi:aspartate/methionine/tyrosine aminotransferase